MMFKPGDRVVCIDINGSDFLKINHIYIISCISKNVYGNVRFVGVDDEIIDNWHTSRFVLLKEQRKQKLEKICSNQETE